MVRTDGPDGKLHDYEIKYTFGVVPLQQYLIEFPDGRLQALGIAWDSRPAEEAANVGSISTLAKPLTTQTNCTGRALTRTGTSCAPSVIRRT